MKYYIAIIDYSLVILSTFYNNFLIVNGWFKCLPITFSIRLLSPPRPLRDPAMAKVRCLDPDFPSFVS